MKRDRAKEFKRYDRSPAGRFRYGKSSAKIRGLRWTLTFIEYVELIGSDECFYCGEELNETGSGLDRIDPALGYTYENVVPCCATCNKIKRELLTHEETIVAIKAIQALRAVDNRRKERNKPKTHRRQISKNDINRRCKTHFKNHKWGGRR